MAFIFSETLFSEALAVASREQADAWLACTVRTLAEVERLSPAAALERLRAGLGVWASLYGLDAMERVWRLYDAPHPVLGSPDDLKAMTPDALIDLGGRLAQQRVALRAWLEGLRGRP